LQDAERPERQDERLDPQLADQRGVEAADDRAQGQHANGDWQQQVAAAVGEGAGEDDREPEQLADRKIDQAGSDDEGLADRDAAERRRLGDDVGEIVGLANPGTKIAASTRATTSSP
jgi:hypothetical protein